MVNVKIDWPVTNCYTRSRGFNSHPRQFLCNNNDNLFCYLFVLCMYLPLYKCVYQLSSTHNGGVA